MKSIVTEAIVLKRINYSEADRILTLLTPAHGKVGVIAKGSRRSKSKLAGGLELFSVSNITFIDGKSELKTVVSTQLVTHFGTIVTDINRTMAAYDCLKLIDTHTQSHCDEAFFDLLRTGLTVLNDHSVELSLVMSWFLARLLYLSGSTINVESQSDGAAFDENASYHFSFDHMAFYAHEHGAFAPKHIKLLRLFGKVTTPSNLLHVEGAGKLANELQSLLVQCVKLSQ